MLSKSDIAELTEEDVMIWECPECGITNRHKFRNDNLAYSCNCGFFEFDISEFVYDVEWSE